ncbi:hypothetical protein AMTRI_Chr10g224600 [Amborella trichopoda]
MSSLPSLLSPFFLKPTINGSPCLPCSPHLHKILRKGYGSSSSSSSSSSSFHLLSQRVTTSSRVSSKGILCKASEKDGTSKASSKEALDGQSPLTLAQQVGLWIMEGVYVVWLFLLPYAPGEPLWEIKLDTIIVLLKLSHNFFYILPLANLVGFHLIEASLLHPACEALFNFVIAWTLMFAPLLFTDRKRGRVKGFLEVLWIIQMFLTNTALIPYMAIRLGATNESYGPEVDEKPSKLVSVLTNNAATVGLIGGLLGVISILWLFYGRPDGGFGAVGDRWGYFVEYILSDRIAYAFVWDIVLYIIFQPWLVGDNLQNVEENNVGLVNALRFIPYVGLGAYLLSFKKDVKSNS